jgi:hypothetical protein
MSNLEAIERLKEVFELHDGLQSREQAERISFNFLLLNSLTPELPIFNFKNSVDIASLFGV